MSPNFRAVFKKNKQLSEEKLLSFAEIWIMQLDINANSVYRLWLLAGGFHNLEKNYLKKLKTIFKRSYITFPISMKVEIEHI